MEYRIEMGKSYTGDAMEIIRSLGTDVEYWNRAYGRMHGEYLISQKELHSPLEKFQSAQEQLRGTRKRNKRLASLLKFVRTEIGEERFQEIYSRSPAYIKALEEEVIDLRKANEEFASYFTQKALSEEHKNIIPFPAKDAEGIHEITKEHVSDD